MIPYNFSLSIDFEEDFREFLKVRLKAYPFVKEEEVDNLHEKDIAYVYFELRNRLISQELRRVNFSNEFNCHRSLQTGLDNIISKIESGEDLTPHLSRQIKDLNSVDPLLNDWGIHHLHLGIEIESDGFAKRRSELLYVFFNDSDAYLIQIMDHRSFSKKELLRIIHNNWPSLIDRYLIKSIKMSPSSLTDSQINQLRNEGTTTVTPIYEDTVYGPVGGGITSARTSTKATMTGDQFFNQINHYEQHIKRNCYLYLSKIKEATGEIPKEVTFKLLIDPSGIFFAYEPYSKIRFTLND